MEMKDKIRVLFDTDADGYIIGYQQEFYDGKAWQTPFDTTNAIEVTPTDLANICLGASKVSEDGTITTDADKKAELEAEANKPEPSPEQHLLANLTLEVAQLKAAKSSD
ncbi:phage infection protein [Lacticaseibacillus sp. 53-4]|uniref:phage infection protein n=1 Tax=Lacticaseibacillus sp. 53-4 TaxID=2799575 RepID=UPI00194513F7|nr:phage infection protein [Lacticaseibacillus sp. 53-4]